MPRHKSDFPWTAAAIGAGCLVVAGIYLVNVTDPGRLDTATFPRRVETSVTVIPFGAGEAGSDAGTSAELTLLDPTPLFLPTIFNSGSVDRSMTTERSPGALFGEIEPKMVFSEGNSQLDVPDVVQIHGRPLDAMEDLAPSIVLSELPRRDVAFSKLPERAAMVEVKRIADGVVLWRQNLDMGLPAATGLVPVEMMVVVDSAGFVTERGALSVAAGGGAAPMFGEQQLDLAATGELLKKVALGRRLSAGIYRISLGP